MHRSLCVCALVPHLQTQTRVVLVLHQLEDRKPTNTGRLAVRCLPNSAVVFRGRGAPACPSDAWTSAGRSLLLFPHADARPLEAKLARDSDGPITLVVPDGTWRQAARARRRVAGLDRLACVRLPDDGAPFYRLRRATRPGRLSTLEAIARALGILEGPQVQQALEHILRVMVDRTLWSNGRLPSERVTGGIPPGAVSHDPWSGSQTLA